MIKSELNQWNLGGFHMWSFCVFRPVTLLASMCDNTHGVLTTRKAQHSISVQSFIEALLHTPDWLINLISNAFFPRGPPDITWL